MKIVVLAGGLSPERDVSLSSGSLIANALTERGHRVALVDLYKGCESIGPEGEPQFFDNYGAKSFSYTVPETEPDLEALRREYGDGDALIGKNVIELCKSADVTFVALHGSMGENGQLQATFDTFGIKYTGTGYVGSLLAMDKDIAKRLMAQSGIPTPEWITCDLTRDDIGEAAAKIGLPCVLKPCSCGSSVGVSILRSRGELERAVEYAKKYENLVLIEKMVSGREFSIGVMDGKALPVIEIIPNEGFYDYANKYQPGFTKEVCPAEIPPEVSARLQREAENAHRALRLGFYSRVDFLLDENGSHFCLEANTLPGMTPTSLLPQEAKAAGISYAELCERIALSALGGHNSAAGLGGDQV